LIFQKNDKHYITINQHHTFNNEQSRSSQVTQRLFLPSN
jgi:hypothetical protein